MGAERNEVMTVTAVLQHELGPFTVADWHALQAREDGSRLELIEGYWLVTPPPSAQHQLAEKLLLRLFDKAIAAAERPDLVALSGVGVEISTPNRTALVPDLVVVDAPPVGASFEPKNVLLIGEIWSPGNARSEQQEKFFNCADHGVPFFWSIAQDGRGPAELAAYRLEGGRYVLDTSTKAGDGSVRVPASPVAVEVDVAALRP